MKLKVLPSLRLLIRLEHPRTVDRKVKLDSDQGSRVPRTCYMRLYTCIFNIFNAYAHVKSSQDVERSLVALERSRTVTAPLATMAAKLRTPSVGSEDSLPTAKLFVPGTPRTEASGGTPRNFL